MLTAVPDNMDNTGRLENPATLPGVDVHKQIGREQRQYDADALAVLPDSDSLVSWQKGLNVPKGEMPRDRLLVLRKTKDGVPTALRGSVRCGLSWAGIRAQLNSLKLRTHDSLRAPSTCEQCESAGICFIDLVAHGFAMLT